MVLRVALGWLMLYAGLDKVLSGNWTAAGFLAGAKTFNSFYVFLTHPGIIGVVNFFNEWGLTLLGVSLILGIFVRWSSILGAILMALYYFASNAFPAVPNGFIVDDHVIYAIILVFFCVVNAGYYYGLDSIASKNKFLKKIIG
ncbi:DoxX family membrane protein [Patescibacteria group bacterium]|nr:DoxX family membrane protein [Patescibacteria group bacterium]